MNLPSLLAILLSDRLTELESLFSQWKTQLMTATRLRNFQGQCWQMPFLSTGAILQSANYSTPSFINLNRSGVVCILVHNRGLFESLQEALDQIKYLDSNDTAYVGMLSEPWLPGNALDPRKHIVHDDHIMSAGRPLYPLCISCVVHRAR